MINLYNGDCLEVMDMLIENKKHYDFTFTSPPYNRIRNDVYKHYDDTKEDYFSFIDGVIKRALKISTYVFFNIQQTYFNRKDVHKIIGKYSDKLVQNIIWAKTNPQPNPNVHSVINSYEYILVFSKDEPNARAKIMGIKNIIESSVFSRNKYSKIHSAVMNPTIAKWFVDSFTEEGDSVLDCFMDVGTTGIECVKNDRDFVGIELSKEYFDISYGRIIDATRQSKFNFKEGR